jgi:prevent-host-death family protein
MSDVSIADLKARLSHYVRIARSGRTVTVLNRDVPVARLVPVEEKPAGLAVTPPKPGSPPPGKVKLPPRLRTRRDIVALLLEERQSHR